MANLKHLNMLGSADYGATSPSEVPEITSNISRKDNPSSPTSDVLSGTNKHNNLIVKEPSISSDSNISEKDDTIIKNQEEEKTGSSS